MIDDYDVAIVGMGAVGTATGFLLAEFTSLQSLLFHWRGNFAVFLGVVVGTAVLTGALLVGDSLRGSLREHTLQQLGWVEEALIAPRFFRQGLAGDLALSGAADAGFSNARGGGPESSAGYPRRAAPLL